MKIDLIEDVACIAKKSGRFVMSIYEKGEFSYAGKSDVSSLALADALSHRTIFDRLRLLTPKNPILSERGELPSWKIRKGFSEYWLVNPLDGTEGFIARNGEFTINIALIREHRAVLGVVYAPAKKLLYFGSEGNGAFKTMDCEEPAKIGVSHIPKDGDLWRIVGSRSHLGSRFEAFVKQFPDAELVKMGSSLKFCLVAEGVADLHPHLGQTNEWDTAAAQSIVEAAGGRVLNRKTMRPIRYNTKESMLNPEFIACAGKAKIWSGETQPSQNIIWHHMHVDKELRARGLQQKPLIIWFTGLSGSGKSTSACSLEAKLLSEGYKTYLLDGDNVRHGLCSDLGFSDKDRGENIRRVGEVSKLMMDAGLIVLVSFISPFTREREAVRRMVCPGEFIEVYVNTPIETCEKRDVKGLYKQARLGKIKNFTGVDSPYEPPESPEISIDTRGLTIEQVTDALTNSLVRLRAIELKSSFQMQMID